MFCLIVSKEYALNTYTAFAKAFNFSLFIFHLKDILLLLPYNHSKSYRLRYR